jgi:Arc/MetJ-type ribon-helix-helix transcriptional regulator
MMENSKLIVEKFDPVKEARNLSAEAIAFAKEFENASDYGKAIIRCVLQQERKNHELRRSLERYLEGLE